MLGLVYPTLGVAVAIGISAAGAQTNGQASSRLQSMTGVVKAVSGSSLTLERGANEITFGVNSSTRVIGKGAKPMDLLYRQPPTGRRLIDLIKAGDTVTVIYRLSGTAMRAVEVRVYQK